MSTATLATPAAAPRRPALLVLLKLRTFIALILVVVFFSAMAPNFMSLDNIVIVSKHVAINAVLAIGMTFVILTSGIDLSVGSIVGLVGMVAGGLIIYGIQLPMFGIIIYPNLFELILISLAAGTLIGAINGVLITKAGEIQGPQEITAGFGGADSVTLQRHTHPGDDQPPTPGT